MKSRSLCGLDSLRVKYPEGLGYGYYSKFLLEESLTPHQLGQPKIWLEKLSKSKKLLAFVREYLHCSEFKSNFDHAIEAHGVFYRRFFFQFVGHKILLALSSSGTDLNRLSRLATECWGHPIRQDDPYSLKVFTTEFLGDFYVSEFLADKLKVDRLKLWFKKTSKPRKCRLCKADYSPIDLSAWAYFGSNGAIDICLRCPIMERPTKKELQALLPAFIETCGFIPSSDISPISYHFMSRQMAKPIDRVLLSYAKMGGVEHVAKKYSSWFEALAKTGALPEGTLVTPRGVRCLATDGHVCHSLDERLIDDWLHSNRIPHTKEPFYPKHSILNPKGKRRADWLVGETYIEYFGLAGDEVYDKKAQEKTMLCSELGLKMIAISPADLANIEGILKRALK